MGGALAAVESGYMKSALVQSHAERRRAIESGDDVVVGLNRFTTTEPNPLLADLDTAIQSVAADVEERAVEALASLAGRQGRAAVAEALETLGEGRRLGREPDAGEPGVCQGRRHDGRVGRRSARGLRRVPGADGCVVADRVRGRLDVGRDGAGGRCSGRRAELGGRLRFLVGKPGLDGHSNGAEQIAVRARDAGFEVVYQGIRLTPEQIAAAAVEEDVHVVGLSVLSGSHMELVPEVLSRIRAAGMNDVPLVVGGIIPESDAAALEALGVAAVFTPKDYTIDDIMLRIVDEIRRAHGLDVAASAT